MEPKDSGFDRRDFLRSLGLALGGTVLSGGSSEAASTGRTKGRALPTYRFAPIFSVGSQQYTLGQITKLTPRIAINDHGEIYFTAKNNRGLSGPTGKGLYRLRLKLPAASVIDSSTVVELGENTGGLEPVEHIGAFDLSGRGEVLVALEGSTGVPAIFELMPDGSLVRLFGPGHPIRGNAGTIGSSIRFVDLLDDGRILFVAHYLDANPNVVAPSPSALFFLPKKRGAEPEIVWKTGDPVPGLRAITTAIGVVDANERGDYALQLHIHGQGELPPADPSRAIPPDTALILGSYLKPGSARLIAASPALRPPGGVSVGSTSFNPRLGDDGHVAYVLHHEGNRQSVHYGDDNTHQSGDATPNGRIVGQIMGPANPADRGLVYYNVQTTDKAHELVVSNGDRARTILTTGDTISGKTVKSFAFGGHSSQIDPAGRIVLLAHFSDKTEALLLGIPA